jgi:secondary thiamine-phosphate synthase enzyme
MVEQLSIDTPGAGLHEITSRIAAVVAASEVEEGLCTLFVRHTSASLLIQENADPSAKRDLERWLNRLGPRAIRSTSTTPRSLTTCHAYRGRAYGTSISIPIQRKKLALGTWQGIYLWEHRQRGSRREVVVHVGS